MRESVRAHVYARVASAAHVTSCHAPALARMRTRMNACVTCCVNASALKRQGFARWKAEALLVFSFSTIDRAKPRTVRLPQETRGRPRKLRFKRGHVLKAARAVPARQVPPKRHDILSEATSERNKPACATFASPPPQRHAGESGGIADRAPSPLTPVAIVRGHGKKRGRSTCAREGRFSLMGEVRCISLRIGRAKTELREVGGWGRERKPR
eukprot:6207851-Pleurochrysis_carterae.AAC.1